MSKLQFIAPLFWMHCCTVLEHGLLHKHRSLGWRSFICDVYGKCLGFLCYSILETRTLEVSVVLATLKMFSDSTDCGHVIRMDHDCFPLKAMFGSLKYCSRPVGRPPLKYVRGIQVVG